MSRRLKRLQCLQYFECPTRVGLARLVDVPGLAETRAVIAIFEYPNSVGWHGWSMWLRTMAGAQKQKTPAIGLGFFVIGCLAVSYSHMGKPHTTIGADMFHC